MNIRYLAITGNICHSNGQYGIGGIGWDDQRDVQDRGNIVSSNVCESNGWAGIQAVKGNHNLIANNVCRNNSQKEPGRWPGIVVEGCEYTMVTGNMCYDDQKKGKKTQNYGIWERTSWDGKIKSKGNVIEQNICEGNLKGDILRDGPAVK